MKLHERKTTFRQYMAFFLMLFLILGVVSPYQTAYANDANNVNDYITWSNPILEAIDGSDNSDVIQMGTDNFDFSSFYDYYFTVTWTAAADASLKAGEYFTFTLPDIFANQAIDMLAPDGTIWGEITIEDANNGTAIGTAVFNSNVENKVNVSGMISLYSNGHSLIKDTPIHWIFTFGRTAFEYKGKVIDEFNDGQGYQFSDYSYKWGKYNPYSGFDASGNVWVITLNIPQESIPGSVTVVDTFGGDYQIVPVHYHEHAEADEADAYWCVAKGVECVYLLRKEGFIKANDYDHAYFQIIEIDWNKIRTDYNAANPGNQITSGINEKMDSMVWDKDALGKYKYIQPFDEQGIDSANITEEGIEIVFKDGSVSGKSLQIAYWFELSSVKLLTGIQNSVVVSVEKDDGIVEDRNSSSLRIGSRATVAGISGSIILFKQNSNASKSFKEVEFTLEKQSSDYSKTERTNDNGQLIFGLDKVGDNYEGTYILTENPSTTPSGYVCGQPITFEVNASGAIIEVNGNPINSAGSLGTEVEDICWVSKDGLLMIVYNSTVTPVPDGLPIPTPTELPSPTIVLPTPVLTETSSPKPSVLPTPALIEAPTPKPTVLPTPALIEAPTPKPTVLPTPALIEAPAPKPTVLPTPALIEAPTPTPVKLPAPSVIPTPVTGDSSDNIDIPDNNIIPPDNQIQDVSIKLTGKKYLSGKELTDNMFSYNVEDENGNIVSVGTNSADGTITFNDIHFKEAGTYYYKVSEVIGDMYGIMYDTTIYDITVTVTRDDTGLLTAHAEYPAGGIIFNNSFTSTSITLTGVKNLVGMDLKDDMFGFTITDENNNIISTGTNKADSSIVFSPIFYIKPGTYTYTISEDAGNINGIIYDKTEYTVIVTVENNETGLIADISEIYLKGSEELKDSIVFTNNITTDKTVPKIPKTGLNDMLSLWIIGLCIMVFLTIILLFVNHKKRKRL